MEISATEGNVRAHTGVRAESPRARSMNPPEREVVPVPRVAVLGGATRENLHPSSDGARSDDVAPRDTREQTHAGGPAEIAPHRPAHRRLEHAARRDCRAESDGEQSVQRFLASSGF